MCIPIGGTLLTVISLSLSTFRQDVTWLDTKCYISKQFFEIDFIYKIMQYLIFLRFILKEWAFRKTLNACCVSLVFIFSLHGREFKPSSQNAT